MQSKRRTVVRCPGRIRQFARIGDCQAGRQAQQSAVQNAFFCHKKPDRAAALHTGIIGKNGNDAGWPRYRDHRKEWQRRRVATVPGSSERMATTPGGHGTGIIGKNGNDAGWPRYRDHRKEWQRRRVATVPGSSERMATTPGGHGTGIIGKNGNDAGWPRYRDHRKEWQRRRVATVPDRSGCRNNLAGGRDVLVRYDPLTVHDGPDLIVGGGKIAGLVQGGASDCAAVL